MQRHTAQAVGEDGFGGVVDQTDMALEPDFLRALRAALPRIARYYEDTGFSRRGGRFGPGWVGAGQFSSTSRRKKALAGMVP